LEYVVVVKVAALRRVSQLAGHDQAAYLPGWRTRACYSERL
jgi:hypothetical protein